MHFYFHFWFFEILQPPTHNTTTNNFQSSFWCWLGFGVWALLPCLLLVQGFCSATSTFFHHLLLSLLWVTILWQFREGPASVTSQTTTLNFVDFFWSGGQRLLLARKSSSNQELWHGTQNQVEDWLVNHLWKLWNFVNTLTIPNIALLASVDHNTRRSLNFMWKRYIVLSNLFDGL